MSDTDLSAAIEAACNDLSVQEIVLNEYAGVDGVVAEVVRASAPVISKAVEAAVREQIARDIEAEADTSLSLTIGMDRAARIARGESQ